MTTAVYWFTNDLRLNDNEALSKAVSCEDSLLCIYCLDPDTLKQSDYRPNTLGSLGPHRIKFLYDSLTALKADLESRGLRLDFYIMKPDELIRQLQVDLSIHKIYCADQIGYFERRFFL